AVLVLLDADDHAGPDHLGPALTQGLVVDAAVEFEPGAGVPVLAGSLGRRANGGADHPAPAVGAVDQVAQVLRGGTRGSGALAPVGGSLRCTASQVSRSTSANAPEQALDAVGGVRDTERLPDPEPDLVGGAEASRADLLLEALHLCGGEVARVSSVVHSAEGI